MCAINVKDTPITNLRFSYYILHISNLQFKSIIQGSRAHILFFLGPLVDLLFAHTFL